MQNRYVADIGDFGKFQLFRFLFNAPSPLSNRQLAQIWFLKEDETHNNDGKYINYFERIKDSDEELEAIMIDIIQRKKREVKELEKQKILEDARFFYPPIPNAYHDRKIWLTDALMFASTSQVVAVAPDNGMALKCKRDKKSFQFLNYHDRKSNPEKYIFVEEIDAFYSLENIEITVVYQHLSRCFSHDGQIEVLLEKLRERYAYVMAIKHKPYSPRVFFFLCKNEEIFNTLQNLLKSFSSEHKTFWEVTH